ncbi:MAG TPA: LysR substrate-binding domain-containing protein [Verrucomicrobiae bacterium]
MELRHLRYFTVVAEELNFRRAAERLHLTRPALSKQIKDLEDELGVRLLERNTVRASLTDAGRVYLVEAQQILAHAQRAAALAKEAAAGRRGTLTVGSAGALAPIFLPNALKSFHEAFPDVEVVLQELPFPDQMTGLAAGELQIAFAFGDNGSNSPHFQRLLVLQSSLGIAVARNHRLIRRPQLSLKELVDENFVCIGTECNSDHADHLRRLFASEGLKPRRIKYCQGFDSLASIIASGHGISLMLHALETYRNLEMKIVPLEGATEHLELHMWAVWRKDEASQLVHNFIKLLKPETKGRKAYPAPTVLRAA